METPLDDYRFDPNFMHEKVKRDFAALLPEGEELLWMGCMSRKSSYWFSKGMLALVAILVSSVLSAFFLFHGYIGFEEGEYAGKYNRVFAAMGAALLPWLFSYFLIFQRLIYDANTRYAFSTNHILLYLPAQKKQPYQWQVLSALGELEYKTHGDDTGTISYAIEVPDNGTGGIGLIFLPLFEFIEEGKAVFNKLVALQEELIDKENAAL